MRTLFRQIVKDYSRGKLDGLGKKVFVQKKLCSILVSITNDANAIFMYDYICYISANLALNDGNEEQFLQELEDCKKKKSFPLRSFILALYYLFRDEKETAVEFYKEYFTCENKNKEINDVMRYVFEKDCTSEVEQGYIHWKKNLRNPVILGMLSNIQQQHQEECTLGNLSEIEKPKKRKSKWIFIVVVVLLLSTLTGNKLVKNTFVSYYKTPEDAYEDVYPDNTLQLKLEGDQSCLLIGSNTSSHDHLLVVENDGKWKRETSSLVKVKEGNLNTVFYYFYQYDEKDRYLVVRTLKDAACTVYDSCDSEFALIESMKSITGKMYCMLRMQALA